MDDLLKHLGPQVLGILVRRGADFAAAEDAVQEALVETVRRWSAGPPLEPKAWLVTVARRKLVDEQRSESARRRREERLHQQPGRGSAVDHDDTLLLLFLCCHPSLAPASAVALTLRAVGGLTTRQIAQAFLVPEATMAQRISRAKRTVAGQRFTRPGDRATVLRVLYLIFNQGYTFTKRHPSEVDLATEAIRLTRQLLNAIDEPEVAGLLALMLLHHARRSSRRTGDGALVPLAEQDRSRWETTSIAEAVTILQRALSQDRLGEYQAQAAIAALHADVVTADETDWPQILQWYDELAVLTDSPVVALNRTVAVGEVHGPAAGLGALEQVPADLPRRTAVQAYLSEQAGELAQATTLYVAAARAATSEAERDHLTRQAARLHGLRTHPETAAGEPDGDAAARQVLPGRQAGGSR